jgi:hypothetical protein
MAGLIIDVLIDGLMRYLPTILARMLKAQSPYNLLWCKLRLDKELNVFHEPLVASYRSRSVLSPSASCDAICLAGYVPTSDGIPLKFSVYTSWVLPEGLSNIHDRTSAVPLEL